MIATIATWFNEGGIFMWAILVVLAFALAIFLERLYFYYITCREVNPRRAASGAEALASNSVATFVTGLEKRRDPLSPLLAIALTRAEAGENLETIQDGIDEEALIQIPRISAQLNYLALIANVATLLGLLGTIAGLQEAFSSLASLEASEKAARLSAGISVAMNTTAFGLVVAIPCMIGYTYLSNKQKSIVRNVDDAMLRLVNYIKKTRTTA